MSNLPKICLYCRYEGGVCPAPGSCEGSEYEKKMKEFVDAQEKTNEKVAWPT